MKGIKSDKKEYFILIKGALSQEDIIYNIYISYIYIIYIIMMNIDMHKTH